MWTHSIYPLPVIYPEFREAGDYSLMEDVFVQLEAALVKEEEESKAAESKSEFKALRTKALRKKIWPGWTFAQPLGQDTLSRDSITFDDFVQRRSDALVESRKRQTAWRGLINDFLEKVGAQTLVVMIDDSDLQPDVARDVVQSLRLYLNHPRVVTVLCVHWDSFRENVRRTEMVADREYWRALTAIEEVQLNNAGGTAVERLVGPAFAKQQEQLDQYLDKVLPPPYRETLPERLDGTDVGKILFPKSPSRSVPDAAKMGIGEMGEWLLRLIHSDALRDFTPRTLVYIRDGGGLGESAESSAWSPVRGMQSLPGLGEDRKRMETLARILHGDLNQHRLVEVAPGRDSLEIGILGEQEQKIVSRDGQHGARYLVDLWIAANTLPLGRQPVMLSGLDLSLAPMTWERFQNRDLFSTHGVPTNAIYLRDFDAITFATVRANEKVEVFTPAQVIISLKKLRDDPDRFSALLTSRTSARAIDLGRMSIEGRTALVFRSFVLMALLRRKLPEQAGFVAVVSVLKNEVIEQCWEELQGRSEWSVDEEQGLELALRGYLNDGPAHEAQLDNALKVFRSYLDKPPVSVANLAEEVLAQLAPEILAQSSWRNRILLVHAVAGPLSKLVESGRISPVDGKKIVADLSGILSPPATEEDRYSALDLIYAHHRFNGKKGDSTHADIIAEAEESLEVLSKMVRGLMPRRFPQSGGKARILPSEFQGLREWSGLSLSALRALRDHVA